MFVNGIDIDFPDAHHPLGRSILGPVWGPWTAVSGTVSVGVITRIWGRTGPIRGRGRTSRDVGPGAVGNTLGTTHIGVSGLLNRPGVDTVDGVGCLPLRAWVGASCGDRGAFGRALRCGGRFHRRRQLHLAKYSGVHHRCALGLAAPRRQSGLRMGGDSRMSYSRTIFTSSRNFDKETAIWTALTLA